ncbi:MAG: ice-binding family protein [Planctomycetes bacterium]|nr:ice-binding family protein [Planctomycetota bacterium]
MTMLRFSRLNAVIAVAIGVVSFASPNSQAAFVGLGEAGKYVLFDVSNTQWSMNNSSITGDMAAGPGSTFNFSGSGGPYNGNFYYHFKSPADPSPNGNSAVPPVGNLTGFTGSTIAKDLTQAVADARSASTQLAALTANQALTNITSSMTITGAGAGSMNVYDLTDVKLTNNTVSITGTSTEVFIFRVSGDFSVGNSQIRVAGGVTPEHVLWDVTGTGNEVKSPNGGWDGTLLALGRQVNFDNTPGSTPLHGQIIATDDATATSNIKYTIVSGLEMEYHPFTLLPPTVSITTTDVPTKIIVGCDNDFSALVKNTGGASSGPLNYTLSAGFTAGSGTIGAISPNSGNLAPGASQSSTFNLAGNIGVNTVSLTVTSPEASNSPQSVSFTQTVYDHSDAQFQEAVPPGDGTKTFSNTNNDLLIDFGTLQQGAGGGSLSSFFDILAAITTPNFTAGLDLDVIDILQANPAFALLGPSSFSNMAAGDTQGYTVTFDTNTVGDFEAIYQFGFSDENISECSTAPGSEHLKLTIKGKIEADPVSAPEPGTFVLALLSLGGLGMLAYRRQRRG